MIVGLVRAVFVCAMLALPACNEDRAEPRIDDLTWKTLSPAPTARTEPTAVAQGELIYVMGGFNGDGDTVPTVEIFDTRIGRWRRGPDLPLGVNHPMSAVVDETVYVFGGHFEGTKQTSDRVFALRNGRWSELGAMPEPRAAGGAAVVDGNIYVVGGLSDEGNAETTLILNTETDEWSTAPGLAVSRNHLGVTSDGDRVFAIGGRFGFGLNLADVEAFDPETQTWERLPELPTPRGGLAATATERFLVAAGGEEQGKTFEEVEAFDLAEGTWFPLPALPTPRHGLGVVAVDATVYVLAGGPEPGLSVSSTVEAIDLGVLLGGGPQQVTTSGNALTSGVGHD
ncbi:MAG: Kelch repeat-containing protein [Actinomycetota bacterium]